MEDIQRVPRVGWEKAGFWLLAFPAVPAVIVNDIFRALGLPFWASMIIVLVLLGIVTYLLSLPIRAARSRRLARDLERGIFDCAIRFPHSTPRSLRDLWEFGAGQIQGTTVRFQTRVEDEQGSPAGRVKTFSNAVTTPAVESPLRRPQGWTRDWKYVHLRTDEGLLQIAGSEPTCTFIEASLPTSHGANEAIGNDEDAGRSST